MHCLHERCYTNKDISIIICTCIYVSLMIMLSDISPLYFTLSLEVTLQKRSEGMNWPELVIGDKRGEYIIIDEQAAHERLSYLTSEDLVWSLSTFILQIVNYHRLWCTGERAFSSSTNNVDFHVYMVKPCLNIIAHMLFQCHKKTLELESGVFLLLPFCIFNFIRDCS